MPPNRFAYYAFGSQMPGRTWVASDYRYSHNGHEKENVVYAGAQSAEYWMYDSRIGRRWEMDPKPSIDMSDYACFINNPIRYVDPNGDKVHFADNRTRMKVLKKALTDKSFRQQLLAQHKDIRVSTRVRQNADGSSTSITNTEDIDYHYTYNPQSPNSLQDAANNMDAKAFVDQVGNVSAKQDYYQQSFSDDEEKVVMRGAAAKGFENGGPKSKKSKQQYNAGTIIIDMAGTYDMNNSSITFYHGAKPIIVGPDNQTSIPIPAVAGANAPAGVMNISTPPINFNFNSYSTIKMVVRSKDPNIESGDPGAVLIKIRIIRP